MHFNQDGRAKLEKEIAENAYLIRGMILQRAVEIESLLDIYIGEHFTDDNDKLGELVCLILAPRVTFENKAQIFKFLIEKYNPEFKDWNKNYFKELVDTIIKERNVFAHYPVSFSEQALLSFMRENVVTFTKLKNEKQGEIVSLYNERPMQEKDVNKLLELMHKHIDNLRRLVNREKPGSDAQAT